MDLTALYDLPRLAQTGLKYFHGLNLAQVETFVIANLISRAVVHEAKLKSHTPTGLKVAMLWAYNTFDPL